MVTHVNGDAGVGRAAKDVKNVEFLSPIGLRVEWPHGVKDGVSRRCNTRVKTACRVCMTQAVEDNLPQPEERRQGD